MFQADIDSATATTQRDIVEVVAGAEVPIRIHRVVITTDVEGDANEEAVKLDIFRYVGAFTSGSTGTTVNAYALGLTGAAEDSATVEVGNPSPNQITGGTAEQLGTIWMNNRAGFDYLPTPEERPVIAGTDAFAIKMTAAFAATTAFAGYIVFEELVS
jgi:hypothetical protein